MKGEAFTGGLSHGEQLKPTKEKMNNIPSSIPALLRRIEQEISFGKWNETWSGSLERCMVGGRRNKVERPRCTPVKEWHLFANNSPKVRMRISQRGRLGSRGLGPG